MSRFLNYFNLLGVLALAGLCCLQWRNNRRANLDVQDLEKSRLELSATMVQQQLAIAGDVADLEDFRRRLELAESSLKDVQGQLAAKTVQSDQIAAERDQLKTALEHWQAAVAARDTALQQANEQTQKMATERNDAVRKFNELAEKYNALVKEIDGLRGNK